MAYTDLNKDSFREAYGKQGIVIVDFWAAWCGPCRNFAPVFERVSEKYPDILFGKVDTEVEQEIAAHFEIRSIPTLLVIRDGVELYCEPGALSEKQLIELVEQARKVDMDEVRKKIAEDDAGTPTEDSSDA
jgi:thioredoxin 1